MKTRKILLALPTVLFPYLVLLAPITILFSAKAPVFTFIMEKLFFGNVWIMVAAWGSIGSAVMAFGLISMGSALLYQRFLNREDPDIYE